MLTVASLPTSYLRTEIHQRDVVRPKPDEGARVQRVTRNVVSPMGCCAETSMVSTRASSGP